MINTGCSHPSISITIGDLSARNDVTEMMPFFLEVAAQVLSVPCLVPTQVDHEEFQQESVLKQLEVLQEEDKEYQHIKV